MSVRPGIENSSRDLNEDSEDDDQEIVHNIGMGLAPEKIKVDREERFVRKLVDPKSCLRKGRCMIMDVRDM